MHRPMSDRFGRYPRSWRWLAVIVGLTVAVQGLTARSEPRVVAVVASDGFSDLRKQITWAGSQAGNPAAAILLESLITGATGGRGLDGLDPRRPLALVIMADGDQIAASGFVPVKSADSLLKSLENVLGPAQRQGPLWELPGAPLGGMTVREAEGWAIVRPSSMPASEATTPGEVVEDLVDRHTLAVKVFPSRMPPNMLAALGEMVRQAASRQTGGQPVDPGQIVQGIENLRQTESITLGLAIDIEQGRVSLENQVVAVDGSDAARALAEMTEATLSVPLSEVGRPLVRGFVAQNLTPTVAASMADAIDATAAGDSNDAITRSLLGSLRAIAEAAIGSGRLDGAFTVGSGSGIAADDDAELELTAGLHVRDGRELEDRLRSLLGPDAGLPAAVSVTLDAETIEPANVHSVTIDLANTEFAERLGGSLTAWLAVTPDHCLLLVGGDHRERLKRILAEITKAPREVKAGFVIQLDVDQAVALAGAEAMGTTTAEAPGEDAKPGTLQLAVRAIERGIAWRLSIDAAAIRTAAGAAGRLGLPAGGAQGLPFGGDVP